MTEFSLKAFAADTFPFPARKFFPITFFGSIIWIALYSYLMVWWATVTGNTIGIPPEVNMMRIKGQKRSFHFHFHLRSFPFPVSPSESPRRIKDFAKAILSLGSKMA